MSIKNSSNSSSNCSGSKKTNETRSCLAVVEADGVFDGRRRVRLSLPLPWRSPSTPSSSFNKNQIEQEPAKTVISDDSDDSLVDSNRQREEDLLGLKKSLAKALDLQLPSTTNNASGMEIELYDSTKQLFRGLERIEDIPPTCCRLRITMSATKVSGSNSNSNSTNSSTNNGSQELLALPWREFSSSIDLDGKILLKGGKHSITIHEVSNSGLGTGTNIWDGAIALAKFLEFHDRDDGACDDTNVQRNTESNSDANDNHNDNHNQTPTYSVRGKRVLELGAGTGLVGIAAHVAFGAREVVLTDLEYSLDNLRENLKANGCGIDTTDDVATTAPAAAAIVDTLSPSAHDNPGKIDVRVLDWFDLETCDEALRLQLRLCPDSDSDPTAGTVNPTTITAWSPEVVLAADVVWVESLVRPLVQTLHRVCTTTGSTTTTTTAATATSALLGLSLSPPPLILLSYQRRSQAVEDLLFRTLEEFSFRTEDVTSPIETASGAESKIRIYRITYTPRIEVGGERQGR